MTARNVIEETSKMIKRIKAPVIKEKNEWFCTVLIFENKKRCSNNQVWSISEVLKSIREYSVDELKTDNRYKISPLQYLEWVEKKQMNLIKQKKQPGNSFKQEIIENINNMICNEEEKNEKQFDTNNIW